MFLDKRNIVTDHDGREDPVLAEHARGNPRLKLAHPGMTGRNFTGIAAATLIVLREVIEATFQLRQACFQGSDASGPLRHPGNCGFILLR